MLISIFMIVIVLVFLIYKQKINNAAGLKALSELRMELVQFRAEISKLKTELSEKQDADSQSYTVQQKTIDALTLEVQGHTNWLGQSHEPSIQRHDRDLSSLSVRLAAYTSSLDIRIHEVSRSLLLTHDEEGLHSAVSEQLERRLTDRRRGLLARGDVGPCVGIRSLQGTNNRLFIVFGGMFDVFAWMKRLQDLGFSVIYVVDTRILWYLEGCDGCGSQDKMLLHIEGVKKGLEFDKVTVLGQSMGGYAALKFAERLAADTTITFAPQTRYLENCRLAGASLKNPPAHAPDVRNRVQVSGIETHVFISASETNNPPPVYYWDDWAQIEGMSGPNIHIHSVEWHDHGTAAYLARIGTLDQAIEACIDQTEGRPFTWANQL